MYKIFFFSIFYFIYVLHNPAHADEIAITFDDIPEQENPGANYQSADKQMQMSKKIISALNEFKAPAIGFVNESKIVDYTESEKRIKILKLWINNGCLLGNHTYSHKAFSSTPDEEFFQDIEKGSLICSKLMKDSGLEYKYFRHPYLDSGSTEEKRKSLENYLSQHCYVIAPITIDTEDWKFNRQLAQHPENKDQIIADYLEHTKLKFTFYKDASEKIFGRNIKHIWLLHCNQINAHAMQDLLKIVKNLGYKFITIEDALTDVAYRENDNYYNACGVSWLYKWDLARGKVVDWSKEPEADNSSFVCAKTLNLIDKTRNRSIPTEVYFNGPAKGKAAAGMKAMPVAIISHDYGIKNTEYSFIANALAARGYLVASIQHDLETDTLPITDNALTKKTAYWRRSAQNIAFVIDELKKREAGLDLNDMVLIGQANGGDVSMMFVKLHPYQISKIILLGNARYPIPQNPNIKILYCDCDDGAMNKKETSNLDFSDTYRHNIQQVNLCDRGDISIKKKIQASIMQFLDR